MTLTHDYPSSVSVDCQPKRTVPQQQYSKLRSKTLALALVHLLTGCTVWTRFEPLLNDSSAFIFRSKIPGALETRGEPGKISIRLMFLGKK